MVANLIDIIMPSRNKTLLPMKRMESNKKTHQQSQKSQLQDSWPYYNLSVCSVYIPYPLNFLFTHQYYCVISDSLQLI